MLYFNTDLLVLKLIGISYISFIEQNTKVLVRSKIKKCTDMYIYIPIYLIFKYLLKSMQQKLLE